MLLAFAQFDNPTSSDYRLSHATICGNRWHYIMQRRFGQGEFPVEPRQSFVGSLRVWELR
jgi:hypothetical protein